MDEFLNRLSRELGSLSKGEQEDIINDFREHFILARQSGRNDAEIAETLGSPEVIARQFRGERGYKIIEPAKTFRSPVMIVMALFLDLALLGPFLGVGITLLALFPSWIVVIFSGIIAALASVVDFLLISVSIVSIHPISGILLGLLVANIGALLFIFNKWIFKYFVIITGKYFSWHSKILRGE